MATPKLLMIFLDESDRWGSQPLHQAVMDHLEFHEVAGATALLGVRAFHSNRRDSPALHFPEDQPVAIMAVDTDDHLRAVMESLQPMVAGHPMLLTGVEVLSAASPMTVS